MVNHRTFYFNQTEHSTVSPQPSAVSTAVPAAPQLEKNSSQTIRLLSLDLDSEWWWLVKILIHFSLVGWFRFRNWLTGKLYIHQFNQYFIFLISSDDKVKVTISCLHEKLQILVIHINFEKIQTCPGCKANWFPFSLADWVINVSLYFMT